jgi:hypothetical protein
MRFLNHITMSAWKLLTWQQLLVLSLLFCVYCITVQRGVSWQDSGEFQYRILARDFRMLSGIALTHPAYLSSAELFTHLFSPTCRVTAINIFSSAGMILALALLARLLKLLHFKESTILIALITLGLSHMGWWMSTIAEVYTWSLALFMAELLCVAKLCMKGSGFRVPAFAVPTAGKQGSGEKDEEKQKSSRTIWLWILLAMVNGLHASFHNFAFLNLPVYALLFLYLQRHERLVRSIILVALAALAWLTGACLLVFLFLLEWRETSSCLATLKSLFFGQGYEDVVLGMKTINWSLVKTNLALASISVLNPVWFFICYSGRTYKIFTPFKVLLLGLTGVHFLFWIRYFVPDQATFVLPTLSLLVIWVAIGLDCFVLSHKQLVGLFVTVLLFSVASPIIIHQLLILKQGGIQRARHLPFRDECCYWLFPWKQNEHSAAQFTEQVRKSLNNGDIIIADRTSSGPLIAAQAAGQLSKEIRIISFLTGETEAELLQLVATQARVYIVSPVPGYASPALLTGQFTFEKEGVLYRVRKVRHD